MSNENNTNKQPDLSTPTTKILAIGSLTDKAKDNAARVAVMRKEVPATVNLYLGGIIEQWWVKPDASGVVFILNVTDPDEAEMILDALPLGIAGMMKFEYIRMAPLTPLRFLFQSL